jgi:fucose permease
MAQLIPFAGYIMFGVLSVPMGIYQDKKGKKPVLILGLLIALIGLVLPMLNGMYGKTVIFNPGEYFSFYLLLLAILLLSAGATILQVVGNPIMRDVSPEGTYSRNLSLAQSIKAIGTSLGFLLPPFVALVFGGDWSILFPVYAILVLITLFLVSSFKISEQKNPDSRPATVKSCLSLLRNGYVFLMVMAIFFYVGAEISMSSGVPILLKVNFGIKGLSLWVSWAIFFLPILIGRFGGSMVLSRMPANKFFIATVITAIIGIILMFFPNELLAFAGVILVGLGFANIFPLVFSITIDRMPERSNELSGLMVTAIAGGAIVPLIMGKVADLTNVLTSFIVPFICLLYIAFTSYISNKTAAAKA